MRSQLMFTAVDSRTEGIPTGVIPGGVGVISGATDENRLYFIEQLDDICCLLMSESHGQAAMSGAILQPSTRTDADWGSSTSRCADACPA